jgi:hypothetical protein
MIKQLIKDVIEALIKKEIDPYKGTAEQPEAFHRFVEFLKEATNTEEGKQFIDWSWALPMLELHKFIATEGKQVNEGEPLFRNDMRLLDVIDNAMEVAIYQKEIPFEYIQSYRQAAEADMSDEELMEWDGHVDLPELHVYYEDSPLIHATSGWGTLTVIEHLTVHILQMIRTVPKDKLIIHKLVPSQEGEPGENEWTWRDQVMDQDQLRITGEPWFHKMRFLTSFAPTQLYNEKDRKSLHPVDPTEWKLPKSWKPPHGELVISLTNPLIGRAGSFQLTIKGTAEHSLMPTLPRAYSIGGSAPASSSEEEGQQAQAEAPPRNETTDEQSGPKLVTPA